MTKKILIATGGTGGHVYPAMALAQQLMCELPGCQIVFVGGGLTHNRYFDQNAFAHHSISCGAFVKKSPKAIMHAFSHIAKGIWQSRKIMREFRPDVVVGFGSFYAFPSLVAAKLMSIPLVLHEANSIPGKVNRLLARWATVIGVHFPETLHLLQGKAVEVGMPLRLGFRHNSISREEARHHFGLLPNRKTLLVFGGSQGAHAINTSVRNALHQINSNQSFQVLHIAGELAMAETLRKEYEQGEICACVRAFEDRMDLAWQAADLVICRSGAGTIAEQLEFEVPGILIPFPRAADNHQEHNADFMVATVGGAMKLHEKDLVAARLVTCLSEFLKDDGALLLAMRRAMKSYKKKARTQDLCSLVRELI